MPLIRWYHDSLVHTAVGRMTATILHIHFYWAGMDKKIQEFYTTCEESQKSKKTVIRRLDGHLPVKPPCSVTP